MKHSDNPQFAEWSRQAEKAPRGFPDVKRLKKVATFACEIIVKATG